MTALGLGGAPLGNLYRAIDDDLAHATVEAAWAAGIRALETAPHYGLGLSERRLGAALRDRPRDSYVLSTKVGRILEPHPAPTGSDLGAGGFDVPDDLVRREDYSADGVRRSLDASLGRLGLDRVDLVLVHDPEEHLEQALSEAVPALVDLRDQGVIRAVGVGMNFVDPLRRFVAETDVDAVMVAGRWTLLDRSAAPLVADCERRGVQVLAAGPYNSGLLAVDPPPDDAPFDYAPASTAMLDRARRLAAICRRHGVPLQAAALGFAARSPAVTRVYVGVGSPEQAEQAARWAATSVSDQTWAALDAVVAGG